MALKNLFGWSRKTEDKASSACGSACGAGDKPAGLRSRRPQAHRLRRRRQAVSARPPRGSLRGRTSQGTESAPCFGKCAPFSKNKRSGGNLRWNTLPFSGTSPMNAISGASTATFLPRTPASSWTP
nr:ACGX-repeat peptide [Oscillibacter valericigenes]